MEKERMSLFKEFCWFIGCSPWMERGEQIEIRKKLFTRACFCSLSLLPSLCVSHGAGKPAPDNKRFIFSN
jgi:hypothetical protein